MHIPYLLIMLGAWDSFLSKRGIHGTIIGLKQMFSKFTGYTYGLQE